MTLRLLIVTYDYYPGIAGGAEQQARLQAEELSRRGYEVTVACPNFSSSGSGTVNHVRVVRLWPGPGRWKSPFFYGPRFFLYVLLNARKFDVVHVQNGGLVGRLSVLAGFLRGRRVYYKVTLAPEQKRRSRVEKILRLTPRDYRGLRLAARVQALTPEIRDQLIAAGVASRRIAVIPNAVDAGYFHPVSTEAKRALRRDLGLEVDKPVFLYAGRFARTKGIDVLLEAWRRLRVNHQATLVIVGSDSRGDADLLRKQESDLIVRGWTSEIRDYYQAADVFVLPSLQEGMSNAVLEAMACGLPVIVTPAGAAAGLVRDGENGIVVPAGEPWVLAEALRRLLGDAALRSRLGLAAAESVKAYSVESVVSRIEAAYEEMVATEPVRQRQG